jgi:integrase
MAIERLVLDSGKVTWRARWRDDRNRQRSKSFRRKIDAERFMTSLQHAKNSGAYVDPAAGRMTVGEWSERWITAQLHLKPKTLASYRSILSTCVLPRWDRVQMGRITFGGVAEWVNDMQREGRSASRVRQSYHLLTGMLHAAVKDGRLPRNPAIGVDLPRLTPGRRRYLRHEQLHALANAAGRYRVLVLTMGYGGLRWGEVSALRVHAIDAQRGRLNITDAVTEVNGTQVFGTPKSHQSRWLPVPAFLLEEIKREVADKGPDDLVFPSPQGAVLRVANFRRGYFDRAAREVGLPGLVPHELRHTAASLAIAAGANVKSVQRMLGHASATLTLDRYGHLFPDELDRVAQRLDEAARQAGVYKTCTEPVPALFEVDGLVTEDAV